jgi:putative ABC transport system permease protein
MVGVILGVGLSCAVLFFVDGLSASMTQRAVAPLPIDMQRVLTAPLGEDMRLTQRLDHDGRIQSGDTVRVSLEIRNVGHLPANEVIVRSLPPVGLTYVPRSATLDGAPIDHDGENPFASGPARAGLNLDTLPARGTRTMQYEITVSTSLDLSVAPVWSSFSTREALAPTDANGPEDVPLTELAKAIESVPGVAFAEPLSFTDLAPGSLISGDRADPGTARLFGFNASYAQRDTTIHFVTGTQQPGQALISVEAAGSLKVGVGDTVTIRLPDDTALDVRISGIVDLTRARSLFASRKGADFETFVYVPNAIVVDQQQFAGSVVPAFERAATERGGRLKSAPLNEVDIGVKRDLLNAEPGAALTETKAIGAAVTAVAGHQDYLVDNISNTLAVARDDAAVAKRMFVYLGIPGGLLAAMLAAYAGHVLAAAQRREQAILRIRGASRRHLLSMLTLRVSAITAAGALIGVSLGYLSAAAVIGNATIMRTTTRSLVISGVLGTAGGLVATGAALYITGRRSIDREINEDRSRLAVKPPVWRRFRLDIIGVVLLGAATALAVAKSAFDGTPGSVYEGRAVDLPLTLLVLPIGAWIAGSLLAARGFGRLLRGRRTTTATAFSRTLRTLYRLSIRRRSWAVAEGAIAVTLIVALGTSLSLFTASYNAAKVADARYVVGSDLRITPTVGNEYVYRAGDAARFAVNGIESVAPVVYGVHNVVLRSHRTEELSSLAAVDPAAYLRVAPCDDSHFPESSASAALGLLRDDPTAILLSIHMADFLQANVGDKLRVLLARATNEQVEIEMHIVGLFVRLPGFPDGADALMNITRHEATVASTAPNFFLARTTDRSDRGLANAVSAVRAGPGAASGLQIDTRATALAKDQSSLAALNIHGLLDLDSGYALAMGTVAIAIFVFGLLLQRRREYVTLRAQGMAPRAIRALISAEAATVAVGGSICGVIVGLVMAVYFVNVLRPIFVLAPPFEVAASPIVAVVGSVLAATAVTSVAATSLVNRLRATELLRDE